MINYSFNITPLVLWITFWNFGSKYVKKVKSIIVFDPMSQKSNVDLIVLQYDLFVLQFNLFVPVVL